MLQVEWGTDLIRSWTKHNWIDLPEKVAGDLAGLIGADAAEIAVADSTSVNIFKLLGAAIELRQGRKVILSEKENFGTDLYVAQGLVELLGNRASLRLVDRSQLEAALDDEVAVLMLTHVDFRTGEMHDMEERTRAAHDAGAVVLWDLAHSAGAVPVDLHRCSGGPCRRLWLQIPQRRPRCTRIYLRCQKASRRVEVTALGLDGSRDAV